MVIVFIYKEVWDFVGVFFLGYMEFLVDCCVMFCLCMMLILLDVICLFVMLYIGIDKVVDWIKCLLVVRIIELINEMMCELFGCLLCIVVCGFNLYVGEYGLFGCGEEECEILLVIEDVKWIGIDVIGFLFVDMVFIFDMCC